jgi:hypothetical protein
MVAGSTGDSVEEEAPDPGLAGFVYDKKAV